MPIATKKSGQAKRPDDPLEAVKRIMGRLVNTPPAPHSEQRAPLKRGLEPTPKPRVASKNNPRSTGKAKKDERQPKR